MELEQALDYWWAAALFVVFLIGARCFCSGRQVLGMLVVVPVFAASFISTVQAGYKQAGWTWEGLFLMLVGGGLVVGGAILFHHFTEKYAQKRYAAAFSLLFFTCICAWYSSKTDYLQLSYIYTRGQAIREDAGGIREAAKTNADLAVEAERAVREAQSRLDAATAAVEDQGRVVSVECSTGVGPKCRQQTSVFEMLQSNQGIAQAALDAAIARVPASSAPSITSGGPIERESEELWQSGIDEFASDKVAGWDFRIADAFLTTLAMNSLAMVLPSILLFSGDGSGGGWISSSFKSRRRLKTLLARSREARANEAAAKATLAEAERMAAEQSETISKAEAAARLRAEQELSPELEAARQLAEKREAELRRYRGEATLEDMRAALAHASVAPDHRGAVNALLASEPLTPRDEAAVRAAYLAHEKTERRSRGRASMPRGAVH